MITGVTFSGYVYKSVFIINRYNDDYRMFPKTCQLILYIFSDFFVIILGCYDGLFVGPCCINLYSVYNLYCLSL